MNLFSSPILFNPRTPSSETREIEARLSALAPLKNHVWVATSGSTAQVAGHIKWIALSHEAILASAQAVNRHLESNANDVWIHPLPHFHVGGMGIFARARLSGARVIDLGAWDAHRFAKACETARGTLSALVPAQVFDLVQQGLSAPRSLRAIVVGGGALSGDLYRHARELGWPVLSSYGMTESCSQIATAPLSSLSASTASSGSQDFPLPELLDHVESARLNASGKLEFRASSLLTGMAVLSPEGDRWIDPKSDGWFTTEDRAELVAKNGKTALRIFGRDSDFIKIGGESVDLSRLEAILIAVKTELKTDCDAALIPIPDSRLGHVIHAVGTGDERTTAELFETFNSKVLPFERARQVHCVREIPRSPLRKLLQAELLKLLGYSAKRQ